MTEHTDVLPNPLSVPAAAAAGDFVARVGDPLPSGVSVADLDEIEAVMRTIYDPEIPVDIYNLGLIYRVDIDEAGDVEIDMTLTAPACPVAGELPTQIAEAVAELDGVGHVAIRLVWDPPWNQDRMSEVAKVALGWF